MALRLSMFIACTLRHNGDWHEEIAGPRIIVVLINRHYFFPTPGYACVFQKLLSHMTCASTRSTNRLQRLFSQFDIAEAFLVASFLVGENSH